MAAPSEQPLIAALDIGSSKVSAMIATIGADGRPTVLGTGQREVLQPPQEIGEGEKIVIQVGGRGFAVLDALENAVKNSDFARRFDEWTPWEWVEEAVLARRRWKRAGRRSPALAARNYQRYQEFMARIPEGLLNKVIADL